ncbi:MAG TPA: sigma-70 family RNA polymerase sigma factor [Steroidobacteraceae bacterium]|nr:sigma-70 family RNA polymerase sigma factor [Steroidobacteraceae bacterium]
MTGAVLVAPPGIEHLLRDLTPQVLGALARRYRDFAAAEDAVQEALLDAATQWPRDGIPSNPGGWLYKVATRRLTDERRSDMARRRREEQVITGEDLQVSAVEDVFEPEQDDTLLLLFMCAHPALTPPTAVALTLRAVGGLTTREIGAAFLVSEATMAQRISRAKQTITDSNVEFAMPSAAERARRLESVLHVLYLIFNEGYSSSEGEELQRVDLSSEAIRLTRALCASVSDYPETAGLLALMLLTDARRMARTDSTGELIPLDEQDRALWDRQLISEGTVLIEKAMARGQVGPYQVQAAIAALHDQAPSTERADWPQIHALYRVLESMNGNPMVTLNRAVAAAMVEGPEAGLLLVDSVANDERMNDHYRVHAVRAHLLERAGRQREALASYQRAAETTANQPERNYLLRKIARLRSMP